MKERHYYLNGEEVCLEDVLDYLEEALEYGGCDRHFNAMGIDFEDIDEKEYLLKKEECCGLDKEERYRLQQLLM